MRMNCRTSWGASRSKLHTQPCYVSPIHDDGSIWRLFDFLARILSIIYKNFHEYTHLIVQR